MKVKKDSPIQLRLTEDKKGVLLKSGKDKFGFDLEIEEKEGKKVNKVSKKGLNLEGESWQSVVPSNWKKLKDAEIKVRK